jgi:hypothetical protein
MCFITGFMMELLNLFLPKILTEFAAELMVSVMTLWAMVNINILYRVEQLLSNDRELGEYTRDISRQRLGKDVPTANNRRATIEILFETGCFYVVRAEEL